MMKRHAIQAYVGDDVRRQLDDLHRRRQPLGSLADLVRELIDLGIPVYIARQKKREQREAAQG
jgi:hypothetical protein